MPLSPSPLRSPPSPLRPNPHLPSTPCPPPPLYARSPLPSTPYSPFYNLTPPPNSPPPYPLSTLPPPLTPTPLCLKPPPHYIYFYNIYPTPPPHTHTHTHTRTHRCMHFWWCWKRRERDDKSAACRREDVGFHFWLEEVKRNARLREEESSRWQVWCIKRIFPLESSWKRGRSEDARRSQSSLDFNELAFSVVTDFAQQLERDQKVTFKNFLF